MCDGGICTCGANRPPQPIVSGFSVSPVLTGVGDDSQNLPTITYDQTTGTFRIDDANSPLLLGNNGTVAGNRLLGTRLFGGAGPSASDFLGNTLPLLQIDRRPDQNMSPSSALSIRVDGAGRVTVVDNYRQTIDAGLRALARLNEIRQMAANSSTTNEQLSAALAEVPALLATYRLAAERVRDVNTMNGMNVYQAIDTWTNLVHQNHTRVLDGVIIGFNMQNLNGRDTSYQSGTAFMELIGHFGPVIASEMGIQNVSLLGRDTPGTNTYFAGVPREQVQEFMNRLRQRVVEFLNGNHPFPTDDMARRIGCERTEQLRIRNWTPELVGMIGGHANATIPESAGPQAIQAKVIETMSLLAARARHAENHPGEATNGFYAGDVTSLELQQASQPLLRPAEPSGDPNRPFSIEDLVRGPITEADIASGRMPRLAHDGGLSIAFVRAMERFFESARDASGNIPPETFRARASELRVINQNPQLYLFLNEVRNAQGQLDADMISRVASTPEQATQLTALLRAAQDQNGSWNWSRVGETSADMISKMRSGAAELCRQNAGATLEAGYDRSLRVPRFENFYRVEAFPRAAESFLNGGEGLVQMIDLKNFYSMKLELGDRNDTAMSRIAELIRQAYAERGIDAIFAKRGDEFYVCMRARTRTGERVDAAMVDGLNRSLTTSIQNVFDTVVLPHMSKYPGDMAGIHADRIDFSVEGLTRMAPDGTTVEEPGVVVRERPANQTEYVILGNEVYVTQQPRDMEAFSRTVMEASQAGLGRSVDPRNGHLHVVASFKEVPDTRGQRRTQSFVQVQVNAETGERRPVILMMPGGEPPRATDVMRGGMPVGATISGAVPLNEAPRDYGLGLDLRVLGDSTSSQKSPLGPDLLPGTPLLQGLPWEATLSPRGRFAFGAVSFGLPGLGLRAFHEGFGALGHANTYTDLTRDYLSMSAGSAMMEPAGVRLAGLLRMGGRANLFGHGFGLVGGTVVMSMVSSNGRATATDIFANVTAAGLGLAGAAAVMRGLRFVSGATSLAGGPVRAILRAAIEAVLIDIAGNVINWGRNQYTGSQLRSAYVTAFRNFDQAVADARAAGPNAPDREARLQLVRTRAHELGQAFNRYLPYLQANNSSAGREYTSAYLAVQSAQDDVVQEHRAPLMGSNGDSLAFVYSAGAHEERETALRNGEARLARAERAMREDFESQVGEAGRRPLRFIPFGTVRDASTYDSMLPNDPADLFVQHSSNVMLRLQSLGISAADMPNYTAALMGRDR